MKKFIIGVIALMVSAVLIGAVYSPSRNEYPVNNESQEQQKLMRAYKDLIHRVYMDRPDYVENVLAESDEFKTLDSLLHGNWDDVFYFHNLEDSITYFSNLKEG